MWRRVKPKGGSGEKNTPFKVRSLSGATWRVKNWIADEARRDASSEHACQEFRTKRSARAFIEAIRAAVEEDE